ncbi:MAG TPA: flagellar biosynthetic protein FliO [Rubrivivax sp.]|nr:flagellar biosynthetic protein FliO [Rubrivivax sp.]
MLTDWSSLLWLIVVIAAIPVTLWLLKRTPMAQAALPGAARTVSVLPLSGSQRLVTIEVGQGNERQWLLLGVSPQGISKLHTMAPQDTPEPAGAAQATPASLLRRLRPHAGNRDAR